MAHEQGAKKIHPPRGLPKQRWHVITPAGEGQITRTRSAQMDVWNDGGSSPGSLFQNLQRRRLYGGSW